MVDLVRALPQGLFWYPFLLYLVVILCRAIWEIRVDQRGSRRRGAEQPDHLRTLALQVARAQTDTFARLELERRCIGLLLQVSDFSGYSVDNCRRYASQESGSEAARAAVASHLTEHMDGVEQTSGPLARIATIVREIERITEVRIE